MRQDASELREDSPLELWRRAKTHGDLQAWAAFQRGLEETVLTWFHGHPGSQAACRLHSEQHFVALASLLYHCGLAPTDIVHTCPHEWNDVQEVAHLRRRIFMHFLQGLADHSPSIISLERG
jgi:hypothetical protein